jgi:GNAT superfamily N-acetyltransferase
MRVQTAERGDIPAWLHLAAEVELLFGPMVEDPRFLAALERNIARGTASCVRADDAPPGAPLAGGLLFSARPPIYTIGWLAVGRTHQRQGVGRLLVEHVLALVRPPADVVVTTFGEDAEAGRPARLFYESLGFRPSEPAPPGPEGGSRQVYRLVLPWEMSGRADVPRG